MKKTIELCKVRPGETFTLDGVDFVKLDEDMGQAFVNFVLGEEGQAILEKYGFKKP